MYPAEWRSPSISAIRAGERSSIMILLFLSCVNWRGPDSVRHVIPTPPLLRSLIHSAHGRIDRAAENDARSVPGTALGIGGSWRVGPRVGRARCVRDTFPNRAGRAGPSNPKDRTDLKTRTHNSCRITRDRTALIPETSGGRCRGGTERDRSSGSEKGFGGAEISLIGWRIPH